MRTWQDLQEEKQTKKKQQRIKSCTLMTDMAGKPNLCRSEPRCEEMFSSMKENAGKL